MQIDRPLAQMPKAFSIAFEVSFMNGMICPMMAEVRTSRHAPGT